MDVTDTLYVVTRKDWRNWLDANQEVKSDIWLISYRKHTGRPSIPYNDAVEEALCYGWIDSIRKGIDQDSYAQRFTPRKPESNYSQTNKERLARLVAQGKVIPSVLKNLGDFRPDTYKIPDDILSALQENEDAWIFFESTSPSYQRIRAAYVDVARKRSGEFEKRLENLIKLSSQGKQFGYGIEDYY
jgi:uncharacterized protein YdeI (YjbR/CyaY-like superfamily)